MQSLWRQCERGMQRRALLAVPSKAGSSCTLRQAAAWQRQAGGAASRAGSLRIWHQSDRGRLQSETSQESVSRCVPSAACR